MNDQDIVIVSAARTPIGKFQVNRHFIAEMQTKLDAAQTYLDQCVLAANDGELTDEDAAGLKWWTTEVQWGVAAMAWSECSSAEGSPKPCSWSSSR